MKSGLVWDNVIEMLNYGTGIAFHDVEASNVDNPSDISKHYAIAQNIIREKLSGRGAKMLAEPNGNKAYVTAALQYPDIQTMVAQNGTVKLYPFQVSDDLKGKLLHRIFYDDPESFKPIIETELQKPAVEREAIHIGVHGTDNKWVEFLKWVNNTYGKDGDDSVWFPSQEEYYEYNYNRIHASIEKIVEGEKLTVKIQVPGGKYFYYPSLTLNLQGLDNEHVTAFHADASVTGMSHGAYKDGSTIHIDCRKHLVEHATYFVEKYEKDKSNKSKKEDALYFVSKLKESEAKSKLLNRIK